MANLSTRKKVYICNLVICFLCILSIVSYFILPFWKVKASYTLTAESIQELVAYVVDDMGGEEGGPENGGEGNPDDGGDEGDINYEDALASINFADIVEDGVTIEIAISLQTKDILSSLSSDPASLVETILTDNVNNIVDTLTPTIDKIAKNLVKTVAKSVLNEQLKSEIKNSLGEEATDEEVKAELESLGLSEEYINTKIDTLVDTLYQEGTTVDSAADATLSVVEDVLNTMKESGNPDYAEVEMDEETKAEIKDSIKEVLSTFADEEGNLNLENVTASLILGALEGKGEGDGDGEGDEGAGTADVAAASAGATVILTNAQADDSSSDLNEEEQDVSEQLKTALIDLLMEGLGDAAETIAMVVKIISYVILFTFFTWFYLILKMLVKLRMKNPAIKLKLPIWLGSLPFWILYFLPTVGLKVLLMPEVAAAIELPAETLAIFNHLSINFFTCAWVSFIVGTFFFFFAIFYYGKLRKRLKKMKKGLIPDDSVAYESSELFVSEDPENE